MSAECPHISQISKIPPPETRLYKDECACCFRTAKDTGGLWICLHCFNGFCPQHFPAHAEKTEHSLYMSYLLHPIDPSTHPDVLRNDAGEIVQPQFTSTILKQQFYPTTTVICYSCARFCGLDEFEIDIDASPVCLSSHFYYQSLNLLI